MRQYKEVVEPGFKIFALSCKTWLEFCLEVGGQISGTLRRTGRHHHTHRLREGVQWHAVEVKRCWPVAAAKIDFTEDCSVAFVRKLDIGVRNRPEGVMCFIVNWAVVEDKAIHGRWSFLHN